MRTLWPALALLAMVASSSGPGLAAVQGPDPVGAGSAQASIASPSEIGYRALTDRLRDGRLFRENEDSATYFVRDQMLGILVFLGRAEHLPESAASERNALRNAAADLWQAVEPAFVASGGYYSVTLATASACADLVSNAWALRAARALAAQTGSTSASDRAKDLSELLSTLLLGGKVRGIDACQKGVHETPLAIWALLERAAAGDPNARAAAAAELARLKKDHFDQAYRDPAGLYAVATNAQLLIVLDLAHQVLGEADHAATRDQLARFLLGPAIEGEGPAAWARSVERSGNETFRPVGDRSPSNQWWLAYALHNHAQRDPAGAPPDLVRRLVAPVASAFWSHAGRGFVSAFPPIGTGFVDFQENALAAYLFSGPALSPAGRSENEVRLVVPKRAGFEYPLPGDSDAASYFVRNRWETIFTVTTNATGSYDVLLPSHVLVPLNLSSPPTDYTPPTTLQVVGGSRLPLTVHGTLLPLLEFPVSLGRGSTEFLLNTYAPVVPRAANVTDAVRLSLHTLTPQPLRINNLYLDVEVDEVSLERVVLNDVPLSGASFETEGPLTTEQLPKPHVRVRLKEVVLRPGQANEFLLAFKDVVAPAVGPIQLSLDAEGLNAVPPEGDRYAVSGQETTHVRVAVADNLALRHVVLRLTRPGDASNATEIRLTPHATQRDTYVGTLPRFDATGVATATVVAIDYQGNQGTSPALELHVQNPFLQGGNLILFVFSLTLFFSALGIYVKMGRKERPRRL